MRGAYRRVSKDLSRAKMTYIMYILIIWSLYSLTNKVEEHCAFPSLLSLICGYLRCNKFIMSSQGDGPVRVTDIKFDRNKQGIARLGCVGWTGARAKSLNDNYSCLSYRSQRGWIVKNLRWLFGQIGRAHV